MDFTAQSGIYQNRIEEGLERLTTPVTARPNIIHEAMRYSLKAGGKRLRPILTLAAAEMAGASLDPLPAAVAVECLHTYSLIHDDLPCVDDSDLRRGLPTNHKVYGEAIALLAGDALLTEAFRILGEGYLYQPAVGQKLLHLLAKAASSRELIGGQVEDVLGEGAEITPEDLDFIHLNKTAALISASLEMGLVHAAPSEGDLAAIRRAGKAMGLAFQIADDVLDATSDAEALGKSAGRDATLGKNTYVKFYGIEASVIRVKELSDECEEALSRWGERAWFLAALTRSMASRTC
jgi:geranylgeranyl pyrophosphate synthase